MEEINLERHLQGRESCKTEAVSWDAAEMPKAREPRPFNGTCPQRRDLQQWDKGYEIFPEEAIEKIL